MKYYQVKEDFRIIDKNMQYYEFIKNELVTEKEIFNIYGICPNKSDRFKKFTRIVNISSKKTYTMFGARFPYEELGLTIQ